MLRRPPKRLELGKQPRRKDEDARQTEGHGQGAEYGSCCPPAGNIEMLLVERGIFEVHVPAESAFANAVFEHTAKLFTT